MNCADKPAFASRFFDSADGLKLHFREYPGSSEASLTVVCLPGLMRNARDFELLAPRLSARYRVLCLDFRGRGLSQYARDIRSYVPSSYARDLWALFAAAGVGEAVIIGTSLGGLVGMLFSAERPENVLGLVLNDVGPEVDPAGLARIGSYVGRSVPISDWEEAAKAIELRDRRIYPDYGPEDWLRTARRRYSQGPDGQLQPDYDLSIAGTFATPATTPDLWSLWGRLQNVPTLLIRGANSDILSRATAQRMQAEMPALHSVEVANRGHVPTLEEPAASAAIDDFLARLGKKIQT